mgnify:CR=1 FL=1
MDKIWNGKSFEVGDHWPLWRGRKKRMIMPNRQKSNAKNKYEKMFTCKGIIMTNNMIGFWDFFYRNLNVCNTRHVSPVTKAYIKVVRVVFFHQIFKTYVIVYFTSC